MRGECIGFTWKGNFRYKYVCVRCGKKFFETTPDLSEPVLCHWCYTGKNRADYHVHHRHGSRKTKPESD